MMRHVPHVTATQWSQRNPSNDLSLPSVLLRDNMAQFSRIICNFLYLSRGYPLDDVWSIPVLRWRLFSVYEYYSALNNLYKYRVYSPPWL